MLFTRMFRKNKKGITLLEMLAAVVITAILASILSMMMVPILNTYRNQDAKAELQQAVTARLNDVALYLRDATGVYVTSNEKSFPDTDLSNDQGKGAKHFKVEYGFALFNSRQGTNGSYLYPELRWTDYFEKQYPIKNNKATNAWGDTLISDDYQTDYIWCPDAQSFYFYVRNNPDNGGHSNVLEVHLKVKKGNVTYEGAKTIVCENLVIKGDDIYTCQFQWDSTAGQWKRTAKAEVSTGNDQSKWKKYYSVWFSKEF